MRRGEEEEEEEDGEEQEVEARVLVVYKQSTHIEFIPVYKIELPITVSERRRLLRVASCAPTPTTGSIR